MKVLILLSIIMTGITCSWAQSDSLDFDTEPEKIIMRNVFNSTIIINSQSTNVCDQGQLSVIIGHRFGTIREGAYNFYGLDEAVMRMGFEYGLHDKVTIGLGRSTAGKNFDGYLKYRVLTQVKGPAHGNIPITITFFSSSAFSSQRLRMLNEAGNKNYFIDNLVYTFQAIVSRQFSSRVTMQLSSTFIHRNMTETGRQLHNIYSLNSGLRVQLKGRLSLNLDYCYVWNKDKIAFNTVYDPLGIGLEVVTGGHVFKLHFTNSVGIIEKEYLTNTTENFFKGEMRFGFTLLRSFMIHPRVKGGSIY